MKQNCQESQDRPVYSDKKCQGNVHMQPLKLAKESNHMWSATSSSNMKLIEQSSSKEKNPVKQGSMCSDRNCQENQNIPMQPVKPATKTNHIQSVTRSSNKKANKPEMIQSGNKEHIHGESPVKSVCSDQNCQDAHMWLVKPEKSSIMQLPKPAVPYKYKRLCSDKNCQSIRYYKKPEYIKCDKNCQSMWAKKPSEI